MPIQLLSLRSRPSFSTSNPLTGYEVPYADAYAFQKECVEKRIRDEIPDTFLFVEHPTVITRGRGLQRSSLESTIESTHKNSASIRSIPLSSEMKFPYVEIERGGDLTAHEPGQLVIYPIVKLDASGEYSPARDIGRFLRKLEKDLGRVLEKFGIPTFPLPDATGVWVGTLENSRKIASIGIAVRKWVTFHGIGFNLQNSLDAFQKISPCGFLPERMTTLVRESPEFSTLSWPDLRERVEKSWQDGLNSRSSYSLVEISTNIR